MTLVQTPERYTPPPVHVTADATHMVLRTYSELRPVRPPTRNCEMWGWCGEYVSRPQLDLGKIILLLEATSYHYANTHVLA